MKPINRKITTLDEARVFIREAIDARYRAVFFTPAMYEQISNAATPGGGDVWRSIAIYPESMLADETALAVPSGWATEWVAG